MKKFSWALVALLAGVIVYQNQAGRDSVATSSKKTAHKQTAMTPVKGSELVFDVTPNVTFGDSITNLENK
jgi:hypothetical protein